MYGTAGEMWLLILLVTFAPNSNFRYSQSVKHDNNKKMYFSIFYSYPILIFHSAKYSYHTEM